jgi:hypothetical protein
VKVGLSSQPTTGCLWKNQQHHLGLVDILTRQWHLDNKKHACKSIKPDMQNFLSRLQVIVVSMMVGSLFFRLGHQVQDARSFHGAAFMAVLFMAMGSMPQIGVVMAQKAVWLKHRDSLLYPGYAHGVVSALAPADDQ